MEPTPAGSARIASEPVPWTSKRGQAAGLEDISGQLRLQIADAPVGVLKVEYGAVEIAREGDAPALLVVDSLPTLLGVLGGEMHPFVAFLQGRLRIEGNRALALQILFGLQADSPWSGPTPRS